MQVRAGSRPLATPALARTMPGVETAILWSGHSILRVAVRLHSVSMWCRAGPSATRRCSPHAVLAQKMHEASGRRSTLEAAGRLTCQVGCEDQGAVPQDRADSAASRGQRPRLRMHDTNILI